MILISFGLKKKHEFDTELDSFLLPFSYFLQFFGPKFLSQGIPLLKNQPFLQKID